MSRLADEIGDSQMQSDVKPDTQPTGAIVLPLINWAAGIFLILLGLYHNLAGGSLVSQWLRYLLAHQLTLNPPISLNDVNMGQLGFEMGGYLAMALGLSFLLLGNCLPRGYYLLWAIVFLIFGGISLYTFKSFHESQLVWLLTLLLGIYSFVSPTVASNSE
jgi:hypothetical protein